MFGLVCGMIQVVTILSSGTHAITRLWGAFPFRSDVGVV